MAKKIAILKNILVYCPKLEKNVTVASESLSWRGYKADCDMCGSHGGVEVDFQCKCGGNHKIELNVW